MVTYHTVVVLSVVSLAIGFLLNSLYRHVMGKVYQANLAQDQEIYTHLNHIVHNSSAQRATIWRVENGGGEIKVGSIKFLSNAYEVTSDELSYTRDRYQRVMLHEFDVKFFSNSQKYDSIFHVVESGERGVLTDRFKSENVIYSYVQPILTTRQVAFFLMMETTSEAGLMIEAKDRASFQTAHGHIKRIFDLNYGHNFTIKL